MGVHRCDICGKQGEWSEGTWARWGSLLMEEDGLPLLITCSDLCRTAVLFMGGPERVLGAIWDARGACQPWNKKKHYKNVYRHTVNSLVPIY